MSEVPLYAGGINVSFRLPRTPVVKPSKGKGDLSDALSPGVDESQHKWSEEGSYARIMDVGITYL